MREKNVCGKYLFLRTAGKIVKTAKIRPRKKFRATRYIIIKYIIIPGAILVNALISRRLSDPQRR